MAVNNKFTITYATNVASPAAGEQVGGTSDVYQLHGPYVIDKSYDGLRLVFDVVVVGTSYDADSNGLQQLSDALETAFRKRDRSLKIDIDGTAWTYTAGTTLLNSTSSIAKAGDRESDIGFSRAYTINISAELPAEESSKNGLRDMEMHVDYEAGRQRIVSMRGVYTAVADRKASAQYQHETHGFDSVSGTLLDGISETAAWELVDEAFTEDRNNDTCSFSRQYVELLAQQSSGVHDDTNIRDHRIVFTDTSQHPGDSRPGLFRLRRVIATYDCAVDVATLGASTNLQDVYETLVRPHITELFEANYEPSVFCIEDKRVGYDETSKRMSVSLQFLYQSSKGGAPVEISQSVAYREQRNIDYTPVFEDDELVAEADPGFAVVERICSRTAVVVGLETPKRRLGEDPTGGAAGPIKGVEGGKNVSTSGWNIVQNTSQVTRKYIGDPETGDQIELSILTETVVERFHKRPKGGSGGGKHWGL